MRMSQEKIMFKWIIGVALLASSANAASAKPSAKTRAAPAQAPSVVVCAVTKEPATPDPKNSVQYNGKTVYFCCSDCKAQFARMSDAQKKAHIAAAQKIAAKANAAKVKKHA